MITDKLYDKAFEYFGTKLWKQLYDMDLFAVEFSDKEIGWCTVMGELGEHISLAVYVGNEGLKTFYDLLGSNDENISDEQYQEISLGQNCLHCSLETKDFMFPDELTEFKSYIERTGNKIKGERRKFVHFTKYAPHCLPWYIKSKNDLSYIEQALEAAVEVSKKLSEKSKIELGFPPDEQNEMQKTIPLLSKTKTGFEWKTIELPQEIAVPYFEPKLSDEAAEELSSFERKGTLECKVFRIPFPLEDKKNEPPRYPAILLALDTDAGMIVSKPDFIMDDEEDLKLFDSFADIFFDQKFLPEKIKAFDDRTVNLLKNFCLQTETPIAVEPVREAEAAFGDMLMQMGMMGMLGF